MSKIQISIDSSDVDDVMRERLHRRLRAALENADVGEVHSVRADESADGSRSSGPVLLGTLAVLLLGAGVKEMASRLPAALGAFIRKNATPITIEVGDVKISIDKPTAEQRDLLLKHAVAAIERHIADGKAEGE